MSDSEAPDTVPENDIPKAWRAPDVDDAGLAALGSLIESKLGSKLETFLERQEKRDIEFIGLVEKALAQAFVNHEQMNKLELRVEALEVWKRAVELKLGISA